MSLVMGAAPKDKDVEMQKSVDKEMIKKDISVIADSPFGRTGEGKEIVKLLYDLNDHGKIVYEKIPNDSRGDWDGHMIRVKEDFRLSISRTVPELVHEASHAQWRKRHPIGKDKEARRKDNVADELLAQENQLVIYKYLKEKKGYPEDPELERRLERQADGKLRSDIEKGFNEQEAQGQGLP